MVVCVLPACCLPACLPLLPCTAASHCLSLPQHCIPAGDCDFKMEVMRGNLAVRGQFQKCVRRRAELSGEGVGGWGGLCGGGGGMACITLLPLPRRFG